MPSPIQAPSTMSIISKLKAFVGLDSGGRGAGGTSVIVEREPAAESERAVKEPTTASTDGADSTADHAASTTDAADDPVDTISGIGPAYAERLAEAGVETVGDLAGADAASLADETGLGEGRVTDWIEQARSG